MTVVERIEPGKHTAGDEKWRDRFQEWILKKVRSNSSSSPDGRLPK